MKQAALAIIKHDCKVILVKRRDVPLWVLPGGGIDEGETPEQAVVREVFEETGLKVKIVRKTGEYTPINRLASETHLYECTPVSGSLHPTSETQEACAFPEQTLPRDCFFLHKTWINDAARGLHAPIKRTISEVTYLALARYFLSHPLTVLRAVLARLGYPYNTR